MVTNDWVEAVSGSFQFMPKSRDVMRKDVSFEHPWSWTHRIERGVRRCRPVSSKLTGAALTQPICRTLFKIPRARSSLWSSVYYSLHNSYSHEFLNNSPTRKFNTWLPHQTFEPKGGLESISRVVTLHGTILFMLFGTRINSPTTFSPQTCM